MTKRASPATFTAHSTATELGRDPDMHRSVPTDPCLPGSSICDKKHDRRRTPCPKKTEHIARRPIYIASSCQEPESTSRETESSRRDTKQHKRKVTLGRHQGDTESRLSAKPQKSSSLHWCTGRGALTVVRPVKKKYIILPNPAFCLLLDQISKYLAIRNSSERPIRNRSGRSERPWHTTAVASGNTKNFRGVNILGVAASTPLFLAGLRTGSSRG